jgi:hypothetical protein
MIDTYHQNISTHRINATRIVIRSTWNGEKITTEVLPTEVGVSQSTKPQPLPSFHAANLFAKNPKEDLAEIFSLLAKTREHLGKNEDQRNSRLLRLIDAARMHNRSDLQLLRVIEMWQSRHRRDEPLESCVIAELAAMPVEADLSGDIKRHERAAAAVKKIHEFLNTDTAGLRITPAQGQQLCQRIMSHATLPES